MLRKIDVSKMKSEETETDILYSYDATSCAEQANEDHQRLFWNLSGRTVGMALACM